MVVRVKLCQIRASLRLWQLMSPVNRFFNVAGSSNHALSTLPESFALSTASCIPFAESRSFYSISGGLHQPRKAVLMLPIIIPLFTRFSESESKHMAARVIKRLKESPNSTRKQALIVVGYIPWSRWSLATALLRSHDILTSVSTVECCSARR